MKLTYLYECPDHGELELEHSIHEDRKTKRCKVLLDRTVGAATCGALLKPLIGRNENYRGDVRPAIFRGPNWDFKALPKWKHETARVGSADPVAVGSYTNKARSAEDLKKPVV